MPNTTITPTWMGRQILTIAGNTGQFINAITKKLSDDFQVSGTKVGAEVRVRLPYRFVPAKGQAIQPQAIVDQTVPITITDQANIPWSWSSWQATLEIQDAMERFVTPAAQQMGATMTSDGLSRVYQDVFSIEGTPGTIPSANSTYLLGAARLTNLGTPKGPRRAVISPLMRATIANANLSLFNPVKDIAELWKEAMFAGAALSWDEWYEEAFLFAHTVGPLGGSPVVNGANQTGSSLVTNGWTASAANRLKKGDHFTIANVYAVNPQSRTSTTQLQQFVVTADTASDGSGNATIPIYPPIVGPATPQYQTVNALPANSAALTVVGSANTITVMGLGFHPEAFVMASADLVMPNNGIAKRVRMRGTGLAMRYWEDSDIMTDQHPSRVDAIYGFKTQRPEFATIFAA